ncbi:MAG: 4-alpha-glucanotransferase [Blastochloris sp.]|nr:4-alpha-glucanotransferase [Blastochloris sp.]
MTTKVPERRAGVFVPIFALRSERDLGVGDTESLKEMLGWCARKGFGVLQVLPINETSDDNSPYNAISSLALDITTLAVAPGLIPGLLEEDLARLVPESLRDSLRRGPVQYRKLKALKWDLCRTAFERFVSGGNMMPEKREFEEFLKVEGAWLDDYALFRALVEQEGHPAWERWAPWLQSPREASTWWMGLETEAMHSFGHKVHFYSYVQWLLHRQWAGVAEFAAEKGVSLMGDMPFGVSRHSADVWAQPEQFDLKWSGGAPPEPMFQLDAFTAKWGQNWGVPVYDWERMESDDFQWWRRRVRGVARFFKLFRIDHVLGFYRVYSFPWQPQDNGIYVDMEKEGVLERVGDLPRFLPQDDSSPENAEANRSHGESILAVLKEAAGDAVILAEDLGVVPDYVRPSLQKLGMSGFKIPMFERIEETREYKDPLKYPELSVATLSTHDHETMAGAWENWWQVIEQDLGPGVIPVGNQGLSEAGRQASWELYRTQRFAGLPDARPIRRFEPEVREALILKLLQSQSWLAVLMITDLFGWKLRFNVPGPVAESNWSERLELSVAELESKADTAGVGVWVQQRIVETDRGC